MSKIKSLNEQLESSFGRAYVARRLLKACEDAGEIKEGLFTGTGKTMMVTYADNIIQIVKSHDFKTGYISFRERP